MSLQVWLPLNGSLENKGLSDLQFSGLDSISQLTNTNYPGKIGQYAYYNPSHSGGGYISDKKINLGKQNSYACWVNFDSLTSNSSLGGAMGGQHRYPSNCGMGLTIRYVSSSTGYLSCNTGDGTNRTFNTYYGKTLLQADTWYHVCMTYDGQTIRLYVNGALDNRDGANYTYTAQKNIEDYIFVGAWSSSDSSGNRTLHGNYKLNGCINDFRAYSHCLSPREVKLLAQGLVAHYKLETYTPNLLINANQYTYSSPLTKTSSSKDGYSTTDMYCQVTPGETYYFSCETDGEWYQHNTAGVDPSNKYATLWFYLTKTYDPNNTGYDNPICLTKAMGDGRWIYRIPEGYNGLRIRTNTYSNGTDAVTIKFWNFHLSKGNAIVPMSSQEIDCSGYSNHGTRSADFNPDFSSPRYKNCAIFENNKYIKCPTRSYKGMKDTYTFSYWARHGTGTSMDGKMVWGFHDGGALDVYPSGGYLTWNTGDGGTNLFKNKGTSIPYPTDGLWHHYAITGNGSQTLLYIDGNYKGQAITYKPIPNSGTLFLSGWNANEDYYRWNGGQISDFRLYATALSAAAVKELYQSSISFLDNGTLQCSEIVESPTNLKYNQNGITQAELISEIGYTNKMKIKEVDSKIWARIYWLNLQTDKTCFQSEAEVLECTNASNRFSLMKYVDKFKSKEGKYEFMLTYPLLSATGYNSWTQTGSPNVNYGTNVGYVKGHTDFPHNSYVGPLTYTHSDHRSSSMYSANKSSNWWSPVGQKTLYSNGIPASNSATTYETELWVRIDNLPKLTKLSMLDDAIQAFQIYEL